MVSMKLKGDKLLSNKIELEQPPKKGMRMPYVSRGKEIQIEVVAHRSYNNSYGGVSHLVLWLAVQSGEYLTSRLKDRSLTRPSGQLIEWIRGTDKNEKPPSKSLNPRSWTNPTRIEIKEKKARIENLKNELEELNQMPGFKFKKKHVAKRMGDDIALMPGGTLSQTVKRDGSRFVVKQAMKSDGTVKTTVTKAHTLENDIQAAQVDRLKARSDYEVRFSFAADQNGTLRGPIAQREAKRTGIRAGDPDMRLNILDDLGNHQTIFVENKNGGGKLGPDQIDRHTVLRRLGAVVYVIKTDDVDLAADLIEDVLDHHMSARPLEFCKELSGS